MKTDIKRSGDSIVVTMEGKLNYEMQDPFKEDLADLITDAKTDSVPKKIIFNFEKLEFVGSSGISSFVQTLKDFSARAPMRPRYCHVKSEFKRIIKAFDEADIFEFFDNEDRARKSFDQ